MSFQLIEFGAEILPLNARELWVPLNNKCGTPFDGTREFIAGAYECLGIKGLSPVKSITTKM